VAQTSGQGLILPDEAVAAAGAACDRGHESSCGRGHMNNHSQNAQSLHTRGLGPAPVAGAEAEAAPRGDLAHSHSHNPGHSRDHNTVADNLLPRGTCDQNGACAEAPCAMLAAARSTDLGHKRLDLQTTGRHRARTGAQVRECHR